MRINAVPLLVTTLCFLSVAHGQETDGLSLAQTIALPNVQGGLNHISVDAERQRLFAASPTNKTIEIVDLKSGKPWRSLQGERPTAARYAREFNQLYVSNGQNLYCIPRQPAGYRGRGQRYADFCQCPSSQLNRSGRSKAAQDSGGVAS
jgi:hypothetical protein